MIGFAGLLPAAALALISVPAAAQDGHLAPMSPAVAARVRVLPATLAGLERRTSNQSWSMVGYSGTTYLDPLITVVVSDAKVPMTLRTAAELGRREAIRVGLVETLFEGRFSLPGHPGALTYFGDFLTKQGIRQSWIAEHDGVRVTISVTIYRAEDRRRVFDAIRTELLGGAEITAKASPAELN